MILPNTMTPQFTTDNMCPTQNVLGTYLEGLGSPILLYQVTFGMNCFNIMDLNFVELHNLHHQVIFFEASVGKWKVKSTTSICFFIFIFPKTNI
jgi:molybdopterin/thiamine biosynthesis adenylyltransferase